MEITVTSPQNGSARLNENGRIVIPAAIRRQMGLAAGDTLLFSIDGDVLKVESHRARIHRIQESMRHLIPPDRCLSDELIAEGVDRIKKAVEKLV